MDPVKVSSRIAGAVQVHLVDIAASRRRLEEFLLGVKAALEIPDGWTFDVSRMRFELPAARGKVDDDGEKSVGKVPSEPGGSTGGV
jgi:hypothetical protein